ncbi:MAG: hypothetical protein AAGA90_05415 [Actinomycetota bacterium]
MRSPIRAVAAVASIALLAAACGGDDEPTAEEQEAVGLLIDAELSLDEQRCVLDGLQRLEITPEQIITADLTPDDEGEVLGVSLECVEDLASIEAFVDSFIAGAADAGTELTREQARCEIRALDESGKDEAILACLEGAAAPQAEGDDPVLDLLVEQCRRGNNQACDELFADAPADSEYATYGQTCGNRLPDGEGLSCFETLG